MSFEDLQAIFELERDAAKRQKLEGERTHLCPPGGLIPKMADFNGSSQEYESALDTTPAEIVASPTVPENSDIFQTPTVVLRHKRSVRQPTPSRGHSGDVGSFMLSPIPAGGAPRKSPSEPGELGMIGPNVHHHLTMLLFRPSNPDALLDRYSSREPHTEPEVKSAVLDQ